MPTREPDPFAREVREQHDALRAALRWFGAEVRRERPAGEAGQVDLRAYLRTLGEHLSQHFRYEEDNGLADALGSADAPDAEVQRWRRALVLQHRELEARLGELLARAQETAATRLPRTLVAELEILFEALGRHEAEENALLLWLADRESGNPSAVRPPEVTGLGKPPRAIRDAGSRPARRRLVGVRLDQSPAAELRPRRS